MAYSHSGKYPWSSGGSSSSSGSSSRKQSGSSGGSGSSSSSGSDVQVDDTLRDAVEQEQARLAEKYPGYVATEESSKNIARNLVEYGTPISPSNRSPAEPEKYPAYTGPSAREALDRLQQGRAAAAKSLSEGDSSGVAATGLGPGVPGRQKAYTQASARIDPATGREVPFGGGMAGQNVPGEKLLEYGANQLFYDNAVRKAERETGRSLERDFSGFKEAAGKVGVERVMDYREGSILTVVETPVAAVPSTQEKRALPVFTPGVVNGQSVDTTIKQSVDTPVKQDTVLNRPFVLNGVSIVPVGLSLRVNLGRTEEVLQVAPDLRKVEESRQVLEKFEGVGGALGVGKLPIIYKYVEKPLYEYAYSEFAAAKAEKKAGLLNAKTEAERRQVRQRYDERIAGITDITNIKVKSDIAPRYAESNKMTLGNLGAELYGRVKNADLPLVDVKLSPGAAAAVTGAIVGASVGSPVGTAAAATAGSVPAMAFAAGSGLATVLAAYSVSTEVREKTGSAGLAFASGLAAAGAVSYGSNVLKAKLAPYNKAEVIANAEKTTQTYTLGVQNRGTTLSKDIYQGPGKSAGLPVETTARLGLGGKASVGRELPVFVKVSNRFGASKTVPTYSAKAYFSSGELGLGASIKRPYYLRDVGEGLKVAYKPGFVETDFPGLSVPSNLKNYGVSVGSRQPIYNQDVVGTYWVGSGKSATLYSTAFKGQVRSKNLLRIVNSPESQVRVDLYSLRGRGFVSEFGKKPGKPLDVSIAGGKLTKIEGDIASGSEMLLAKIGGKSIEKQVPLYVETFEKVSGGSGLGAGKLLSNKGGGLGRSTVIGSSNKVPFNVKDVNTGLLGYLRGQQTNPNVKFDGTLSSKSTAASAGGVVKIQAPNVDKVLGADVNANLAKASSSAQSSQLINVQAPRDLVNAQVLGSVGRQAAALEFVGAQAVESSPSFAAPLLISDQQFEMPAVVDIVSSQGAAQLSIQASLPAQYSIQESRVSQNVLNVPRQAAAQSRAGGLLLIQEQLQKPAVEALSMRESVMQVLEKQDFQQGTKQSLMEKQILKQDLRQDFQQILKQDLRQDFRQFEKFYGDDGGIDKIIPGGGGGGGGILPGGGGKGVSSSLFGTRYTLKNPWPDAQEFAEDVLGSGKKRRKRKK